MVLGIDIPGFPSWDDIFDSIRGLFEDAYGILTKSWSDVTGAISTAIDGLSDIVDHTWSDVTGYVDRKIAAIDIPGLPSWREIFDNVKGLFESKYSILKKSWSDVTGYVDRKINALPSWAKDTFDDAVDDFIDGFQRRFAASETRAVAFLTALGIGAGDVITTILDTPREMFQWIRADIENTYDIVNHRWEEVTGAISTAIDNLSDIVDHSWEEVTGAVSSATATLAATIEDLKVPELWTWVNDAPGWFVDQFNGMKETVVDWIVERFEGILDRVFKE